MRRHLGHYMGVGKLQHEAGNRLRADYELDEYQDVISEGSREDPHGVYGLKNIEGMIRCGSILFPGVSSGKEYVLELKDGKKVKLLITWTDGVSARVKATGGFF